MSKPSKPRFGQRARIDCRLPTAVHAHLSALAESAEAPINDYVEMVLNIALSAPPSDAERLLARDAVAAIEASGKVTFRFRGDLKHRLDDRAKAYDVSRNRLIVYYIAASLGEPVG